MSRGDLIDSAFSTVICAPIFSERRGLSTEVYVGAEEGLEHDSAILRDTLVSLEKDAAYSLRRFAGLREAH